MSISSSMALIPDTKSVTSREFIRPEVEKGGSNSRSINQKILDQMAASSIFCLSQFMDNPVMDNPEFSLLSRSVDVRSFKNKEISEPLKLNNPNPSFRRFRLSKRRENCEDFEDFEDFESLKKRTQEFNDMRLKNLFCVSSHKQINGEEVVETLQSEASFTIATDKKPIVATFGCFHCVALGGYDPTNKIAFVIHFTNAEQVRESGGLIFHNIAKLVKEKIKTSIQLHLRGGIKGQSEPVIEAIKVWMKQRKDLPMEIASEDILTSKEEAGKSLSVDSRTGEISEYDLMSNSKPREISDLDITSLLISRVFPRIKLAYSPKSIQKEEGVFIDK